ncbi:MAG: hypothetical protein V4697_03270 [Patescibacteria group bacterium]
MIAIFAINHKKYSIGTDEKESEKKDGFSTETSEKALDSSLWAHEISWGDAKIE